MWKKEDRIDDIIMPASDSRPQPTTSAATPAASRDRATIGRSITVRGDVTGDEDLLIQGRVEGNVDLQQHAVTVGADGEVIASIVGRVVMVEGRVEGNIDAAEQIVLRSSSHVRGDLAAPKVVLENGARFRGLVDMGEGDELAPLRSRVEARSAPVATRPNGAAAAQQELQASASTDGGDAGNGKAAVNGKGKRPVEVEATLAV